LAGNELQSANEAQADGKESSSESTVEPSSAAAREIISSLLHAATSPPSHPSDPSSSSSSSSYSTDPLPLPLIHLPVIKVPGGGIDRYDDSAPQLARQCLKELQEKGVLVLDCGMDANLPACLHHASVALARYVTQHEHTSMYIYIYNVCVYMHVHETWCVRVRTKTSQPSLSSFSSSPLQLYRVRCSRHTPLSRLSRPNLPLATRLLHSPPAVLLQPCNSHHHTARKPLVQLKLLSPTIHAARLSACFLRCRRRSQPLQRRAACALLWCCSIEVRRCPCTLARHDGAGRRSGNKTKRKFSI
jgi:hypothetical protein